MGELEGMAGAFAILLHVTQVLPYIVVGLIFLVREGLSLGQLQRDRLQEGSGVDAAAALREMDDEAGKSP